ncbi:hypothetical protein CL622_03000 [archaeon]|nr:hypothetical protein [archaeon]
MEEFDVIVVGGGVGGSTCTWFLGTQHNRKVLLLEKAEFPRDKICGDAISGKSAAILNEMDLNKEIEKKPHAEIHGVTFSSPNGSIAQIPFKTAKGQSRGTGYVCRRMDYDNLVFQKGKQGAHTLMQNFQVTDLLWEEQNGNTYCVGVTGKDLKTKEEKEFRAKVVVGADGATSVVSRKVGNPNFDPKHHCAALRQYWKGISGMNNNIEIHFIDSLLPGYFWIFPLEKGYANVGVGMVTEEIKKHRVNLVDAMNEAIKTNPMLKDRFKNAEPMDAIKAWNLPFGSDHRKAHGNGWVLIGDAASLIDPFSGEGVGNAMLAGKTAAKYINRALSENFFHADLLVEYEKELWDAIGPELDTSYKLQKIGRIKTVLNLVVSKAQKSPQVRETISSMLGSEEAKKNLAGPLFYLKLLFA